MSVERADDPRTRPRGEAGGTAMIDAEVIIIGGGPGGSSCAWRLKQHGIDCIVLDAEEFPRTKLCAGWITPEVVRRLGMDSASYPHPLLPLETIVVEYFGKRLKRTWTMRSGQFSIRRYEFDDWLLARSGAPVHRHRVREIRPRGDLFMIDDRFRCRFLVGAGGTGCPVYRTLFKEANQRSKEYQVAALEQEFEYPWRDQRCYLWFGEHGLPGYSWYVPKGKGWINVGIGGFGEYLGRARISLQTHWALFVERLSRQGLIVKENYRPKGHTYFVRAPGRVAGLGNAFLVGDAAGLATRDLGEGIGPAVESGVRAADAIATGERYSVDGIGKYSLVSGRLTTWLLDRCLDRSGLLFRDWVHARSWRTKEAACESGGNAMREDPR